MSLVCWLRFSYHFLNWVIGDPTSCAPRYRMPSHNWKRRCTARICILSTSTVFALGRTSALTCCICSFSRGCCSSSCLVNRVQKAILNSLYMRDSRHIGRWFLRFWWSLFLCGRTVRVLSAAKDLWILTEIHRNTGWMPFTWSDL